MAYSAYCDTDPPTKWWVTGTGSTINRLSEVMDDNAAGVERDDNPGVFVAWNNFMTEHVEDKFYEIILNFEIGDGSTSTTLLSKGETVYFHNCYWKVLTNATLTLGELSSSCPFNGSSWHVNFTAGPDLSATHSGTINTYLSHLKFVIPSGYYNQFFTGVVTSKQSIWDMNIGSYGGNLYCQNSSSTYEDCFFTGGHQTFTCYLNTPTLTRCTFARGAYSLYVQGNVTADTARVLSSGIKKIGTWDGLDVGMTAVLKDPIESITQSDLAIGQSKTAVHLAYTTNIHITDQNGNNLAGATVTLDGSVSSNYDTQQFSVSTAADGTITEQDVVVKKWVGTSETETDYNLHKLTVSRSGYRDLILENITIDGPIDWHLELSSQAVHRIHNRSKG